MQAKKFSVKVGIMSFKKAIIFIIVILLIILLVFLTVTVFKRTTNIGSRADAPRATSLENSYVFASPLIALANGLERIRVTVFILDSQGMGVERQTVNLKTGADLTVEKVQPLTDNIGKAVFDLSTTKAATYAIEAMVDEKSLSQRVSIIFR